MPAMTQNDFLNPLFSLNPFFVALIILFLNSSSIIFFALRTKSISIILQHPGVIFGDLVMIPLTGFLITYFYQQINSPINLVLLKHWVYITVVIALFLTILSAYRTFFIFKSAPIDIWIVPHLMFYWLMAYVLVSFFFKGILQLLLGTSNLFLWSIYVGVVLALSIHFILPIIFGPKTFLKAL